MKYIEYIDSGNYGKPRSLSSEIKDQVCDGCPTMIDELNALNWYEVTEVNQDLEILDWEEPIGTATISGNMVTYTWSTQSITLEEYKQRSIIAVNSKLENHKDKIEVLLDISNHIFELAKILYLLIDGKDRTTSTYLETVASRIEDLNSKTNSVETAITNINNATTYSEVQGYVDQIINLASIS